MASARGAQVTATDWATDAVELLAESAARNGLALVLAADVLYERRNVEPLVERLQELAPIALLALAGRPYEDTFVREWPGSAEQVAERVLRLTPRRG